MRQFLERSATRSGCTRHLARCRPVRADALRGSFQASRRNLPSDEAPALRPTPVIVWMSFRAGLFLGGLLSSMARFRFANRAPVCCNVSLPVEYHFSSNGHLCLNCLCQSRGQAHIVSSR